MRVVIAGGHGQIALLLARRLADAGHDPIGLIRNPDHEADVVACGGEAVLLDLENSSVAEVATTLAGADAVVFAAGSGPGAPAERKLSVDRDGAIKLADAAASAGVNRYVLVSAIAADDFDPGSQEIYQIYLRAKSEADAAVRASGLAWTVVRPGGLTDEPATGRIRVAGSTGCGQIPRDDVAAVVVAALGTPSTLGKQFELISGDDSITEALNTL